MTKAISVRHYAIVTGNYWAFTLTDGALRMLVVLHFYQLGYSALQIAALFLFYEFFGVITNLLGGYAGARLGLKKTMNTGLALQVIALAMLALPAACLTMAWVMAAQALSGIAKDLNKMSAKSAIKTLLPPEQPGRLLQWVAWLTGSKNALKGVGFFLGGTLLALVGFTGAVLGMAAFLLLVWLASIALLPAHLGRAVHKPKFRELFAKSRAINVLSAARLFLFAARDVWFVVALPVFLSSQLGWGFEQTGAFLASWVIGYGVVQALAPRLSGDTATVSGGWAAVFWALVLAIVTALLAIAMAASSSVALGSVLVGGLVVFGVVFAINSSLHSYWVLHYAARDSVSLDVGFYYMANALGRLLGTVLSGYVYQQWGMSACLWVSAVLALAAALTSVGLLNRWSLR